MTRAGHRLMQTTKLYLHLAGTTFPDEAAALGRAAARLWCNFAPT
jgi:hypothetical protein